MKKNYIILSLTFFMTNFVQSQIVDNSIDDPGDIVITAYHNNSDGFSFVFLDNCPIGASIRFVDEEWNGSAFASLANEGEVLWTNTSGGIIVQGTVVHIENADDELSISASIGTAVEDDGGFGIASTNDGIIAITGTRSNPGVFLAFFGDTTDSVLSGTSLVNGSTANQQASYGTGYYSGASNCDGLTITECAERLNSVANWTVEGTFTYPGATMSSLEVSGVLSANKFVVEGNLKYFPNPVRGKINIVSDSKFNKVNLLNSLGVVLKTKNKCVQETQLDLSDLNNGIYYIEVLFSNKRTIQKIVKE